MKSYVKLAYTMIIVGMAIFTFERYGLQSLSGNGTTPHLPGLVLSFLVLAPVILILGGCAVFAVGRMRGAK
jgi:hypothetical protein